MSINHRIWIFLFFVSAWVHGITVQDAQGDVITLASPPQRVIPLNTSLLLLWYECGGHAVGRPQARANQLSAAIRPLPEIGHLAMPSSEKILALKPDLILSSYQFGGHERLIPLFKSCQIPVLRLHYETFQDYIHLCKLFYQIMAKDTTSAQITWKKVRQQVDQLIHKKRQQASPRVLILFGSASNVTIRKSDSHVGSMVQDLGGINIAENFVENSKGTVQFSLEKVVEKNPEIILIQCMGDEQAIAARLRKQVTQHPAWKNIEAVQKQRVHLLPSHFFLYKPNARWSEAYQYLEKLLYAEEPQ